jgi:hypothetical protein
MPPEAAEFPHPHHSTGDEMTDTMLQRFDGTAAESSELQIVYECELTTTTYDLDRDNYRFGTNEVSTLSERTLDDLYATLARATFPESDDTYLRPSHEVGRIRKLVVVDEMRFDEDVMQRTPAWRKQMTDAERRKAEEKQAALDAETAAAAVKEARERRLLQELQQRYGTDAGTAKTEAA